MTRNLVFKIGAALLLLSFSTGGFDGDSSSAYTKCFWDTTVNPDVNGLGEGEDPNVIGLSTTEMQTQSTFTNADWDFNNTWAICEGTNYPRLQWAIPVADLLCPDGVNFLDFAFFSDHWLHTDCPDSNNCDYTDFDLSGSVDANDLKIFNGQWLQ